ncbi:MAG: hypothetical protein R3C14_22580 [Caldilineaceae bacterium]
MRKYYYAAPSELPQRVAMRENGALRWLLSDHLGSTAYTINGTTETSYKFTICPEPVGREEGKCEEAGLGLPRGKTPS